MAKTTASGPPPRDESQIAILGQVFTYPKTVYGTLSVLFLGLTIVAGLYIGLVAASPANLRTLGEVWVSYELEVENGEVEVRPSKGYKLQFWTPSVRTAGSITEAGGEIQDKDLWEVLDDPETVVRFGEILKRDSAIGGYRRYEVFGHGRTQPKTGWWWVMTVDEGFTLEEFARIYREFWNNPDDIYVEVVREGGTYAE